MTTSDDERLKGTGLTRYVIRGRLGQGGSGVVYDAYDTVLEREVALKIIENTQGPDFLEKVRNEAVCAAKIQHPNIVPIYDFGVTDDGTLVYIAMEKLPGYPLREVLRAVQCLTVPEGIAIGLHLCAGIQAIHDLGIVHRDITPANIMVGPAMQASLLDFGIAKFKRPRKDTTGKFVLQGTPLYVSPETCRGGGASPRSDLYAVGTVLHTLFLGDHFILRNHPHADYEDILRAHLTQVPEPLCELIPGFPRQLSNIVARAMAKEPADRWPSAFEMGEKLAAYEREFSEECRLHRLTPTMRDLVALTRAKNSTRTQAPSLLERTTLRRLPDSIPSEVAPAQPHGLLDAFTRRSLTSNPKPSSANVKPSSANVKPSSANVKPSSANVELSVEQRDSALPRAGDRRSRVTIPRAPEARRRAGLSASAPADRHAQVPSLVPSLSPEPASSRAEDRVLTLSEAWFRSPEFLEETTARAGLLERLDAVPLRRFIQWAVVLSLVVSLPLGILVGRSGAAKFARAASVESPHTSPAAVAHLEPASVPEARSSLTSEASLSGPSAVSRATTEGVQAPEAVGVAPTKPPPGVATTARAATASAHPKAAAVKLPVAPKATPLQATVSFDSTFVNSGLDAPQSLPVHAPSSHTGSTSGGAGATNPVPSGRRRMAIY